MSGYPTRISRASLGPTREDRIPAPDDTGYVAARYFNLEHWQLAGLNVVAPRACGLIDGTAGTLTAHSEAWAPNGGDPPSISKTGTGVYELTYPSTAENELEELVSVTLTRARGAAQSSVARTVTATVSGGNVVTIYTWDAAGAAADADVWFEAW